MEKEQKIGYGLITISVILMIIGSVGYTVEGDVNDVPTPNVPDFVFFSDEPLPSIQQDYFSQQMLISLGIEMTFS